MAVSSTFAVHSCYGQQHRQTTLCEGLNGGGGGQNVGCRLKFHYFVGCVILIDVRFIPLMLDVAKTIFSLQNVEVSCECYYK